MASSVALGALAAHPGIVDLLSPATQGSARGRRGHAHIGAGRKGHLTALLVAALVPLALAGLDERCPGLLAAAGDRLLLEVGDRLGRCVRTGDTVVRLGGDEFALLLPDTAQHAAALTAQRVLAQLREPFVLGSTVVRLAGSIGTTLGAAGSDLDELLRNADLAMYEAKSAGRDQAVAFDPAMHQRAARRLQVDADLRAALTRGEFTVYYQPIVDATSGEVTCLEALVR